MLNKIIFLALLNKGQTVNFESNCIIALKSTHSFFTYLSLSISIFSFQIFKHKVHLSIRIIISGCYIFLSILAAAFRATTSETCILKDKDHCHPKTLIYIIEIKRFKIFTDKQTKPLKCFFHIQ